jgi:tetratricopeptide (TPR) repeat protein
VAERLNHPFTLAYALFHAGLLDLSRRDFELVYERSGRVLDVAEEHDYETWGALGLALQGAAMVGLGRSAEGLDRMNRGIALYEGLKTPPVFWPLLQSLRAGALGLAGRPADGLDLVEALRLNGESNITYPELALLRGDLLLGLQDVEGARRWFRRGLEVAPAFGLRMPQLRASARLARISASAQERRDRAEELRGIYSTFTEGFDALDLVEARAVLDELGDRVA